MDEWDIYQTDEVATWLGQLQDSDPKTADLVDDAIYTLSRAGPAARRHHHQLEDREPERTPARFPRAQRDPHPVRLRLMALRDPARRWRQGGNWTKWYARIIPRAEQLYEIYLKERAAEEGSQ